MGFITSNAWLDVAYGYELQKYMVNNFKIIAILESRCEPWFEDTAVNTVVTILERCSDKTERDNHIVKFVKVKKKLAELIPWNAKLDALNRWTGLDGLFQKLENAGIDYFKIEGAKVTNTLGGVETREDADFRIRLVRQSELRDKLNAEGKTAKWGQYLRAPQVYFDILKECGNSLVPLKEVADIRRGYTTGINEFFYLTEDRIRHWNIEEEFLTPLIKSPKEFTSITINPAKLEVKVFTCHKTKTELLKARKRGALNYIEWGEEQVTKGRQKTPGGVAWLDTPSLRNKQRWYDIGELEKADYLCNRFFDIRFFFGYNPNGVIDDQTFYGAVSKNKTLTKLQSALLNSTLSYLCVEFMGRTALGEGALQYAVYEMADLPVINAAKIDKTKALEINKTFDALSDRHIKSIFEEVKMKDRQKLDKLVLEAMGLDSAKYLQPIYDGLTELVRERIELAGMRQKLKQAKPQRDIAKMMEQVTKDLVKEGIKKFPDDFLHKKPKPQDCSNVAVPDVPLRLGDYFLGQQEVAGEGFSYQAPSLAAAKYIIYARKPAEYIVSLPNDEVVVTKAVTDYERYLKELFQKLNQGLLKRLLDHKQAETLSRRIFQELGLSDIAAA